MSGWRRLLPGDRHHGTARAGPKGDETQTPPRVPRIECSFRLRREAAYGEVLMRRRSGSLKRSAFKLHEVTVKVDSLDAVTGWQRRSEVLEKNHKKKDYDVVVPLDCSSARSGQSKSSILCLARLQPFRSGWRDRDYEYHAASVTSAREIGMPPRAGRSATGHHHSIPRRDGVARWGRGHIGCCWALRFPSSLVHTAGMKTIITFWSPLLAFTIQRWWCDVWTLSSVSRGEHGSGDRSLATRVRGCLLPPFTVLMSFEIDLEPD